MGKFIFKLCIKTSPYKETKMVSQEDHEYRFYYIILVPLCLYCRQFFLFCTNLKTKNCTVGCPNGTGLYVSKIKASQKIVR